jgi:hypothetical protein
VKDLVNAPAQKYENIYNTISSRDYTDSLLPTVSIPPPPFSKSQEAKSMKEELKNFLKSKAGNEVSGDTGATNIAMLDSFSSPNFSSY